MPRPISELIESLAKNGCKAQVVSISRLAEAESALLELKRSGSISTDFYPELTKYFDFDYKAALPEARSIVIVASPQLPTRVFFGSHAVIIPPTYIYLDIWKKQTELVTDFLRPRGYHVARARLPFKTLAARSGLGRYGRNNICYIPGMGSFFRLAAFYSDMPCKDDGWGAPKVMKLCQTCKLCMDKCPTGCIPADRFLIHADRCLTHFNESENPLPAWLNPEWHNALLGCMICQKVCPLNKELSEKSENAIEKFILAETQEILAGTAQENLRPTTVTKLESLCLADSDVYPILKRNLSLLMPE
ncbi:MAG: epoxyqueuosine reductase [Dehalococcoidia bacterium]|nr:MAG: epoxyqueuosine reductase [Dehalococcoidia bacterium]